MEARMSRNRQSEIGRWHQRDNSATHRPARGTPQGRWRRTAIGWIEVAARGSSNGDWRRTAIGRIEDLSQKARWRVCRRSRLRFSPGQSDKRNRKNAEGEKGFFPNHHITTFQIRN
jgi:hypothetical protein